MIVIVQHILSHKHLLPACFAEQWPAELAIGIPLPRKCDLSHVSARSLCLPKKRLALANHASHMLRVYSVPGNVLPFYTQYLISSSRPAFAVEVLLFFPILQLRKGAQRSLVPCLGSHTQCDMGSVKGQSHRALSFSQKLVCAFSKDKGTLSALDLGVFLNFLNHGQYNLRFRCENLARGWRWVRYPPPYWLQDLI